MIGWSLSEWVSLIVDFSLWPLIHILVSKIAFTQGEFNLAHPLYRERSWERGGRLYIQAFKIKSWKRHLPDGSKLFSGSFRKSSKACHSRDDLKSFYLETFRGEWAHWMMVACAPVFFLWNPLWADAIIVTYALAANIPAILVQRYNRLVFARLLCRKIFTESTGQVCTLPF